MRKRLLLALVLSLAVSAILVGPAAAHETPDNAPDTPLAAPQAVEHALDNYVAAIGNSDGAAANSLFRNPTCGAHESPGGVHPPGNP